MNKAILLLFVFATVLTISPVVSAQRYDFTDAGSEFAVSDWLPIYGAPSQDGNHTTAGDLTWDNPSFSPKANPGDGRRDQGSAGSFSNPGRTDTFESDDLFITYRAKDGGFDNDGRPIEKGSGREFINIWSNDKGIFDSFWAGIRHRWHRHDRGDRGNDGNCGGGGNGGGAPPVHVPEYGALSMLILSTLTLAGGFCFKVRQSGWFHAS